MFLKSLYTVPKAFFAVVALLWNSYFQGLEAKQVFLVGVTLFTFIGFGAGVWVALKWVVRIVRRRGRGDAKRERGVANGPD